MELPGQQPKPVSIGDPSPASPVSPEFNKAEGQRSDDANAPSFGYQPAHGEFLQGTFIQPQADVCVGWKAN